ncbi:hypothetical protein B0A54_05049 [Friedmanniomyces endolithicus]|uniref:Uncharacterized protein n=1 Tax=Friedmanniomyces endolithicus TaxID=329885 RepID=A0A4U0V8L9_9PEZI|nr:hypothetical protein B0A54_05049 [Friedmanniomyces endolithicus]
MPSILAIIKQCLPCIPAAPKRSDAPPRSDSGAERGAEDGEGSERAPRIDVVRFGGNAAHWARWTDFALRFGPGGSVPAAASGRR